MTHDEFVTQLAAIRTGGKPEPTAFWLLNQFYSYCTKVSTVKSAFAVLIDTKKEETLKSSETESNKKREEIQKHIKGYKGVADSESSDFKMMTILLEDMYLQQQAMRQVIDSQQKMIDSLRTSFTSLDTSVRSMSSSLDIVEISCRLPNGLYLSCPHCTDARNISIREVHGDGTYTLSCRCRFTHQELVRRSNFKLHFYK